MYHKLQLVGCPEFIPRHEEWNANKEGFTQITQISQMKEISIIRLIRRIRREKKSLDSGAPGAEAPTPE